MASYLYADNVSPKDRFEQLQLQFDSGSIAIIKRGFIYNLTNAEASRARRFVVLIPSNAIPVPAVEVGRLPIIGDLEDGDVPVWDSNLGAFVPGTPSGGGGGGVGNERVLVWNSGSSAYNHPEWWTDTTYPREFRGPNDPSTEPGITLSFADTWEPTAGP